MKRTAAAVLLRSVLSHISVRVGELWFTTLPSEPVALQRNLQQDLNSPPAKLFMLMKVFVSAPSCEQMMKDSLWCLLSHMFLQDLLRSEIFGCLLPENTSKTHKYERPDTSVDACVHVT